MNKIEQYRIGDWLLDLNNGTLSHQGACEKLPNKPYQLLLVLAKANGQIVTIEQLTEQVWDGNIFTSRRGIVNNISKLRALFSSSGDKEYIENIPKCGYRLLVRSEPVFTQFTPLEYNENQLLKMRFYRWPALLFLLLITLVAAQLFSIEADPIQPVTRLKPSNIIKLFDNEYHESAADIEPDTKDFLFSRKQHNSSQVFWQRHLAGNPEVIQVSHLAGVNTAAKFIDDNQIAFLNIDEQQHCSVVIQNINDAKTQKIANCHPSKQYLKYHKRKNQLLFFANTSNSKLISYDLTQQGLVKKPSYNLNGFSDLAFALNAQQQIAAINQGDHSYLVNVLSKQRLAKHKGVIADISLLFDDEYILYSVKQPNSAKTFYLTHNDTLKTWLVYLPRLNPEQLVATENGEIILSDMRVSVRLQRLSLSDGTLSSYGPVAKLDSIFSPVYHQSADRLFFFQHNSDSESAGSSLMTSDSRFNHLRQLDIQKAHKDSYSEPLCDNQCKHFVYTVKKNNTTSLWRYDLATNEQSLVTSFDGDVTPLAWLGQQRLLVSIDNSPTDSSGTYELNLAQKDTKLIKHTDSVIGKAYLDLAQSKLFYTSPHVDGIWQMDWHTKGKQKLVSNFNRRDFKNFYYNSKFLIYLSRQGKEQTIVKRSTAKHQADEFYKITTPINNSGFTAIDNGSSIIFSATQSYSALWSMQLKQPEK